MIKIFCIGKISEDYRTQNTLRVFLNHRLFKTYYNGFYITPSISKNPFLYKIKEKLYKIFSIVPNVFYMIQSDIIFVFAMQHGSFPVSLARYFKKKIVVDFYISFYDTEVNDYKKFSPESKNAKRLKRIDRLAIFSKCVFFLTPAEAIYYTNILNIDLNLINYRILPLCINKKENADLDFFHKKRKTLNLCWCGSYIPLQGLDVILQAASILKGKIDFHLYIWGASEEKSIPFKKIVQELSLEEFVTIHNEWENIKTWEKFIVTTCDVTLGIFGQSSKAKTVLANKILDGVAFRTPVVTAHSDGLYNYFTGKDDIFTTNNTPVDLADCIENIYRLKYNEIIKRIDNAYKIYQDHFTPERFEEKVFSHLCEQNKK